MAKDKKHTKPENWVSFREIYAAERVRFHLPVRRAGDRPTLEDKLNDPDPVLRVMRNKLKRQPYRYLDRDGVRHENDLSDDFIDRAIFSTEESSAVWYGWALDVLLQESRATADMYVDGDDAIILAQTMAKQWDSICDSALEAYAIELLEEAPALVASTPAPLPEPLKAKAVLFQEINRRKAAGERFPRGRAAQAHNLAEWMKVRAQSGDTEALNWRTIQNYLPKGGL